MLPDTIAPGDQENPARGRELDRIREVALERIIGATAVSRIQRTLCSHVTPPGQRYDYQPGDLADFYTPATQKDLSGWQGPAVVVESIPDAGMVILKWRKGTVRRKFVDVRRFMDFTALAYNYPTTLGSPAFNATAYLEQVLRSPQTNRKYLTVGYIYTNGIWRMSKSTSTDSKLMLAVEYIVRAMLNYTNVVAARVGRGVRSFAQSPGAEKTILLYWNTSITECRIFEADGPQAVHTKDIVGELGVS